jgi:hypothetical protein
MRLDDDKDAGGRPQCRVCGKPIRAIEEIPLPDGGSVHFYCFGTAHERARQHGDVA